MYNLEICLIKLHIKILVTRIIILFTCLPLLNLYIIYYLYTHNIGFIYYLYSNHYLL